MGLGVLKILSSQEVPHYKFLYLISFICYTLKPWSGLLLRHLHWSSSDQCLFFIYNTLVIHNGFVSLASLLVPCVLGTIVTQMSFLVTLVTLNFTEVSPLASLSSMSSFLKESSLWSIWGCIEVDFFAPHDSPSWPSSWCVHGIWVS